MYERTHPVNRMPQMVDMALYPCAVIKSPCGASWRIVVPDLAGCDVTGTTYWETKERASVAARDWIVQARLAQHTVPQPSSMDSLLSTGDYSGWDLRWLSVEICAARP